MSAAHPVEKHEATMQDHESRIQSLETAIAVQSEQIKNSYVTLGEIKQMIADIRTEITAIKGRSGKKWDSLEALALTAIGMAGNLPWSDFAPERDYIAAKWAEVPAEG